MIKNFLLAFILCLPLFFSAHAVHAQAAPETCPEGELLSLGDEERDSILASGCYTQEAANAWCDTNFAKDTTAMVEDDDVMCTCNGNLITRKKYEYNSDVSSASLICETNAPEETMSQEATACPAGELLSVESPSKDHAVAPGCYTQEAANAWCDANYMANTTASADGDTLFCNCIGEGYSYDTATQSCTGGADTAMPVEAPVAEGDDDTCQCPKVGA